MIATCRALQAKCHPEHGNAVRDWDRGHSRERITLGGEEAVDSCVFQYHLLHRLLQAVLYVLVSRGLSQARLYCTCRQEGIGCPHYLL